MARQSNAQPTTKIFNIDLELSQAHIETLLAMVAPGAEALTDAQKIGGVALGLLRYQAGGGLMLRPKELERIAESTGLDPTCGEDLLDAISKSTGMAEGKYVLKINVDPVWMEYFKQPAEIQGRTVEDVIQEVMDYVMDNDPMQYLVMGQPQLIRMTEKDFAALTSLLGEKFDNGTELVKLIKQTLGGPLAEEEPEPMSNVGQEV